MECVPRAKAIPQGCISSLWSFLYMIPAWDHLALFQTLCHCKVRAVQDHDNKMILKPHRQPCWVLDFLF